jgi:protease-4
MFMGSIIAGIWNGLSWIRVFILNLIFLVFIGIIVASIFSSSEIALVPDSGALIINPTGNIVEQKRPVDPLAGILNTGSSQYESETLLSDLLDAIQQASTDQRIKIIILETDSLQGSSLAQLSDIGAASLTRPGNLFMHGVMDTPRTNTSWLRTLIKYS